jgi:pyruvate dehydrogenase (quinone)
MTRTVGDQFVEILAAASIKRIYGVVGDSLNAITDAVRRHPEMGWVHVRHEEVAAFAAGAEAHLTGSIAVCAGSCGPGNLHLINGLFDCHRSRVPVLAIAAHIPSPEIGSSYFQETHPQNLFKECSHYCELVSTPAQLPRVVETAIREAVGKSGVSVVVIPGDVALGATSRGATPGSGDLLPRAPLIVPPAVDIAALADLLNNSNRVTMFCGAGCAGARDRLVALAERLQAPIVHTMRGKEHVEGNPYDVGMTGLIGFASGYYAMNDCDTLLLLGTDFPYRQFYPAGRAQIVQIDIRPENLGHRAPINLGLVGDVAETINRLLPLLDHGRDSSHLDRARSHYAISRASLDALAAPGRTIIHPQQIAETLSDLASENAVFTCDVGLPTVWAARHVAGNGG